MKVYPDYLVIPSGLHRRTSQLLGFRCSSSGAPHLHLLILSNHVLPAFQSQCKCQPFSKVFPDQPARSYFLQHSALNGIGTSWHSGYVCPWKVSHLLGHSPWRGWSQASFLVSLQN